MTQKFEREIEEILKNLGDFVPEERMPDRAARRLSDWWSDATKPLHNWRRYLTVQWIMVSSIVLVMVGFVLRGFLPAVASYANMLGLILFVAALAMSVFRWGSRRPKTWRGRVVEISAYDSSWWQALLRRWRLWRRRW